MREIRTPPWRIGAGGRSIPRNGLWIRGHLEDVGRDSSTHRPKKRSGSRADEKMV